MAIKHPWKWKFPDGPVVRTLRFHCCSLSSVPGQGTKTLHKTKQNIVPEVIILSCEAMGWIWSWINSWGLSRLDFLWVTSIICAYSCLLYALNCPFSAFFIWIACGQYSQGYPALSLIVTVLSVRSTWWKNITKNWRESCCCCSVSKSCLILLPNGLQHARLPSPPLSPRVCSSSCLLSQYCFLLLVVINPVVNSQNTVLDHNKVLWLSLETYVDFHFDHALAGRLVQESIAILSCASRNLGERITEERGWEVEAEGGGVSLP